MLAVQRCVVRLLESVPRLGWSGGFVVRPAASLGHRPAEGLQKKTAAGYPRRLSGVPNGTPETC